MESLSMATTANKARVDLAGGRLASLEIGGIEMMVTEGVKPTRWGSFPMIPWCGRLDGARLRFEDHDYDFPATSPPHANHGVAHLTTWTVEEHRESEVVIGCDLSEPWPFGGRVDQAFTLGDECLTVAVSVTAGSEPMPVMVGWHPWFRRELAVGEPAELTVAPEAAYATNDRQIPTGELVPVPDQPWDHCFPGLASDPLITWPGAIELTISSTFDHWVIFTEPEHALCVEPQSGPPNQLNGQPVVIGPGETFDGSMTLRWRRLSG